MSSTKTTGLDQQERKALASGVSGINYVGGFLAS